MYRARIAEVQETRLGGMFRMYQAGAYLTGIAALFFGVAVVWSLFGNPGTFGTVTFYVFGFVALFHTIAVLRLAVAMEWPRDRWIRMYGLPAIPCAALAIVPEVRRWFDADKDAQVAAMVNRMDADQAGGTDGAPGVTE